MCGIFGLVAAENTNLDRAGFQHLLEALFLQSESRGKEAAGAAFCTEKYINVIRKPLPASELIESVDYKDVFNAVVNGLEGSNKNALAVIGHARLVTNGMQGIDANNQPVIKGGVVCVHNGIIVNEPMLWSANPDLKKQTEVDTEVVAAFLDRALERGDSIPKAACDVFQALKGEASLGVLFADSDRLLLATNTGSLYFVHNKKLGVAFYCSELAIAKRVLKQMGNDWISARIAQLGAGKGLVVSLLTAAPSAPFDLDGQGGKIDEGAVGHPRYGRLITNTADKAYKRWLGLKRCTRCILPETMPYIKFDDDGVCNYCRNYEKHRLEGEGKLLKLLDQYRSKDGSADCLVGFSGGRDSSYGLHLIKSKYGMNPIAYTYDWGMVTDLARRNQARLCGKLGVEHIWVSADIKEKRRNVKCNVEAWMKKPELGMVPLFMAGDKQFMWHANRLMKETGLRLMVYSTNHFERTDFKTGFCGVPPKASGVQLNKMSGLDKIRMILYYLRNYLSNPGYINGSLSDTFTAFLSYYFVKQDFLYLFDYLSWDEKVINDVLVSEYEWELAKDTTTTWRIGDGTAPFYNYIYQTIAGFSEYETFRSNQIREGVISRDEAMHLVMVENKPRIDSIREYCAIIGVDFDSAMRVIDSQPKMY